MSHSTLVIPNVDAIELEQQRIALSSLDQSSLNQVQQDALNGICEMLDYWPDRAHRLYTVILSDPEKINLAARSPTPRRLRRLACRTLLSWLGYMRSTRWASKMSEQWVLNWSQQFEVPLHDNRVNSSLKVLYFKFLTLHDGLYRTFRL